MLHLIDNVAAGEERFVPVPRADADPNRHVTDGQIADAVDASGVLDAEPLNRLGEDALALLDREGLERFVLEVPYGVSFVVIAHQPFEG